jgi:hypothetical protein
MQPSDTLAAGVEVLGPELVPHGFRFEPRGAGHGSGGPFAWGEFVRGDRRLELHFRWSLGFVIYHVGELSLGHEAYLRALGIARGTSHYPGFSDDPLDGFRHLAQDLARYLTEFVQGDAAVFESAAPAEMARLAREWETARAGHEGDEQRRAGARAHFRAGEFARVVELLGEVRYPDLLSESERHMLAIAQRRAGGLTSR